MLQRDVPLRDPTQSQTIRYVVLVDVIVVVGADAVVIATADEGVFSLSFDLVQFRNH